MRTLGLVLVAAALLGLTSNSAYAKHKRVVVDLHPTAAIADGAIDTTSIYGLPSGLELMVDAAVEDSEPAFYLVWSFTAATTDSFAYFVDFLGPDGNVVATDTQALAAFTSGAYNAADLTPGFLPSAIRMRLSNTDVTGSAATTATSAKIVCYVDD